MSEIFILTTPLVPPTRVNYDIQRLTLDWTNEVINFILIGSDGIEVQIQWRGPDAIAIMRAINKANLTVKTLQARLWERAAADGKLPPGTVTGTPA